MRRSAYVEAIALLNEGIGLLTRLPLSGERDSYELQLQVALGVCYANTRGYAAPEVGATFERAHTLWQQNCATAPRFRALRGLWFFAEQRAHLQKARSVAEELLEVAARQCDPAVLVEGHRIMATTAFHLGDFAGALEHAQRGLALHEVNHSADAFLYGQDPGVCCLAWNAWAHWYLGLADKAVGSAVRGVELARELRHPFTLSYALNFTARLFLCRREPERAESYAREGLQVAREHGLTSMVAMGQIMYGLSRTYGEQTGIEDLEEGVSRWRATGARLMTPYWMSLLATGLYNCGRTAKATEALDDALREAERTDERWFSCEMYMLRATLAGNSIRGPTRCEARTQAHLDLRQALRVATELRSPSLQLRAARALSPLLRDEGKAGEARELLGATYATFREGFGTLDLVEARAELARLGA
jgi:tetratricopeptide (TPR) repeat protein